VDIVFSGVDLGWKVAQLVGIRVVREYKNRERYSLRPLFKTSCYFYNGRYIKVTSKTRAVVSTWVVGGLELLEVEITDYFFLY